MAHAISIVDGETRANERLEALKRRSASAPDYEQELGDDDLNKIMDRDLYKATKNGDVEKFIDELEKVIELRKLALSLIFDQVIPSGDSLLHVAASSGNDDVVELILLHFPNTVTQRNSREDTPLHVAIRDGRFNATEKLIRSSTNSKILYWKNKDGKSPLYLAVERCKNSRWKECREADQEILWLLLEALDRDKAYAVQIQGMSLIVAAIGDTGLLKEIIIGLPKLPHMRDEKWGTPLHAAAASVENGDAIDLLLEKCPYLAHQTDKNGSYPIHIACEAGNYSGMGRDKNNKKGQNILHVAAEAGAEAGVGGAVYKLQEKGESDIIEKLVNSKDVDGNTPLHLASMHNHYKVISSLTGVKGIDLQARNNNGLTALDVAVESRSVTTKNRVFLGRALLIVAGGERSKGRPSGVSKSSHPEWIKDQVNTLLLVATLVASVTFTAGITLPGGYNAFSDPHPGTATMLHHGLFQVFVIANMLAMYSSILAVVVLLWGLSRDFYVAELAYHLAGPLLLMALIGMSMAFFSAVTVAVSKLTWLASLVPLIGVLYLAMVTTVLATLIFPLSKAAMHIVCIYYLVDYVVVTLLVNLVRLLVECIRL
ncbi:protein ACCELERATED CELL DEATH 6 [Eucalyptus grandis]|uniref:protein ACCELERATED CELL DEATH 6 n=1 Tax=Eucalyptus grandis TaxID=71139 RepID=UPI00192EB863|nr:protein ACCELERATED CELL DEATH 6 [Eucalyptus grandis]